MAGLLWTATTLNNTPISVPSTTQTAVIRVDAPANQRVLIPRIRVTTNFNDPTVSPGIVCLYRCAATGTFASNANVPQKVQSSVGGSVQTRYELSGTGVPGSLVLLEPLYTDRGHEFFLPLGLEYDIPAGGSICIACTFDASVDVFPVVWGIE